MMCRTDDTEKELNMQGLWIWC